MDGWRLSYGETVRASVIDAYEPIYPHGTYMIVTVAITNTSLEPTEFPYRNLMVVDGEDRIFSVDADATYSFWTTIAFNDYPGDTLQPAIAYRFPLVFDVATSSNDFTLTSRKSVFEIDLGV